MLVKVELSTAWADELGWTDADIASVLDIVTGSEAPDSPEAVCPRCARQPVDYKIRFFKYDSAAETAEGIRGRGFVNCVCGRWYSYAVVDKMDSQPPVGQSHVPTAVAAPASKAVAPPLTPPSREQICVPEPVPPGQQMLSDDFALFSYRRRGWHPGYDTPSLSAPWIHAAVQAERANQELRARVANSAHLRQNGANDQ
jgi:hypothetical protein